MDPTRIELILLLCESSILAIKLRILIKKIGDWLVFIYMKDHERSALLEREVEQSGCWVRQLADAFE